MVFDRFFLATQHFQNLILTSKYNNINIFKFFKFFKNSTVAAINMLSILASCVFEEAISIKYTNKWYETSDKIIGIIQGLIII